jgi:hypothetical protein
MTMLKAGSGGGEERFDQLGFPQLAQEAQGVAADIFVRVLQIIPNTIAANSLVSDTTDCTNCAWELTTLESFPA